MKVLAQPIGVASTTAKHNLLEVVEHEITVGSVQTTNQYVYVKNTHGSAVAADLGVAWQGDEVGGITLTLGTGSRSAQFVGINTGLLADNEYGWVLIRGQWDLGLAAGALRLLECSTAGVLSAAALAATADGDVGLVMDDGIAVIGFHSGLNTLT